MLPSSSNIMFSNRRRLRQWAARVLLMWLFGLSVGIANGCALASAEHGVDAATTERKAVDTHLDMPVGNLAPDNCLDFCEKSSVGVPKLKLSDDIKVVALPTMVSSADGVLAWHEQAQDPGADPPDPRSSPPLRITYQRLAL
jgi:hypothetical protein